MILDDLRLDGKVALVTGGSQGRGLGMAEALAQAGADVAVAARCADRLGGWPRRCITFGRCVFGLAEGVLAL